MIVENQFFRKHAAECILKYTYKYMWEYLIFVINTQNTLEQFGQFLKRCKHFTREMETTELSATCES